MKKIYILIAAVLIQLIAVSQPHVSDSEAEFEDLFGELTTETKLAKRSRPDNGIGIRLGDLVGFTYKRYMGDKAFEISVGNGNSYSGNTYYYNRYGRNDKHCKNGWNTCGYAAVDRGFPFNVQLRLYIQKDLNIGIEGFQWYAGGGVQFLYQRVEYRYYGYDPIYREGYETKSFVDLGIDGVGGIEYQIPQVPITAFFDLGVSLIVTNSFYPKGLAGIGARYNF